MGQEDKESNHATKPCLRQVVGGRTERLHTIAVSKAEGEGKCLILLAQDDAAI